ncbi:MAG: DUF421 domain-containing protein [Eubacterium sp.]
MEFLQIVLLAVVSFVVLFIIAKVLGYRQISELSFFDYIVGITIGSIAAEMSTNIDIEWWKGITAMVIYAIFDVVLGLISQKSNSARKVIDGTPIIIINKGKISKQGLKKAKIEIDDLLTAARVAGYFNIADIDYAIMEITGKISFLPVPLQRPLNPKDFNFAPERTGLCVNVILDGELMQDNLPKANLTEKKLNEILKQRDVKQEQILLATVDEAGTVEIFKK